MILSHDINSPLYHSYNSKNFRPCDSIITSIVEQLKTRTEREQKIILHEVSKELRLLQENESSPK